MISKILPSYCYSGRTMDKPEGIVVHYFSAANVDPDNKYDMTTCRRLFKDLNRPRHEREFYMKEDNWPEKRMYASAHVLIGRDGEVWRLVEFSKQAYHAGKSILNGREGCNQWTLGVELVGGKTSGFTRAQYFALADFIAPWIDAGMARQNVAGHDTVRYNAIRAGLTSTKKFDPSGTNNGQGDNFSWDMLWKMVNDRCERTPMDDGLPDVRETLAAMEGDTQKKPIILPEDL